MNSTIFQTIDTKEKAYWLGFIFADGYVKKTMFRFCLSVEDEEHLDKFIEFIGGDKSTKKYYGPYKTSGKQVHYLIHNKEFVGILASYGCVNKKSYSIRFPDIKEEFCLAFLRGCYDGDGTAGLPVIVSGSKEFLKDICNHFNIDTNKVKLKGKQQNTYILYFGAELFYKMVNSVDCGLTRKTQLRSHGVLYSYKTPDEKKEASAARGIKQQRFEISVEDLKKLVWEKPLRDIGKQFGVTGNAIKKRCKRLDIAWPPQGHWLKKKSLTQ